MSKININFLDFNYLHKVSLIIQYKILTIHKLMKQFDVLCLLKKLNFKKKTFFSNI
jgi:hypothetical protein